MRILITGATGFAARHLVRAVRSQPGVELVGLSRHELSFESSPSGIQLLQADLCDRESAERILRQVQPDQIYHLAGYSDAGRSFQDPEAAWAGNLTATRNLYEGILRWGGGPRVLFVSSGAVYGEPINPQQPVDERSVLRPNSPYAASKAAADLAGYQYFRACGLQIVRARPFNHIGPGQSASFAVANFARQIAAVEKGLQAPVIQVGNLWTERDLTDVRDVVRAYALLMEKGVAGEAYNIASGRSLSLRVVLDQLLGLSTASVKLEANEGLQRNVDTTTITVDLSALGSATGWAPSYSLEQSLADTLNDWRLR